MESGTSNVFLFETFKDSWFMFIHYHFVLGKITPPNKRRQGVSCSEIVGGDPNHPRLVLDLVFLLPWCNKMAAFTCFSCMNKVILRHFGGLTYKPLSRAHLLVVGWFRFPCFWRLTLEPRFKGWLGTRFSALGTSGLGHSRIGAWSQNELPLDENKKFLQDLLLLKQVFNKKPYVFNHQPGNLWLGYRS